MQARGVIVAVAGLTLFAAMLLALMVSAGAILEPPYVERSLGNAADAGALCDVTGPGPTPWIEGRLAVEPGAVEPAWLERPDGVGT